MKALVLGGYGRFGAVVARRLARDGRFAVVVAGRDGARAASHAGVIGARGCRLDAGSADFAAALADIAPDLVIHAAGPYAQGDYAVARAAIAAGAHCIDLADARGYVCGIGALHDEARAAGVLAVAGASSVPALSAAAVDRLLPAFARLDAIEMGISASSQLPGEGTVRSVLSYAGRPIPRWTAGAPATAIGGQGLRRHRFAHRDLARWVCDCDVPDIELFPARYAGVRDVRFAAGTGLAALQWLWWLFAGLVRVGIVRDPARWAPALRAGGGALRALGDGRSAMFVTLRGTAVDGRPLQRRWELHAAGEDGPEIPCLPAVALAKKLASGQLAQRGAVPCVGLLALEEILAEARDLDVQALED